MILGIGSIAPDFKADTTEGIIHFYRWLGRSWGLLFSHPEDYTPVCTTELGTVAQLEREFTSRNVKAIALSVDTLEAHRDWKIDIENSMGVDVRFPIIADADGEIAHLYGMIPIGATDKRTVRSVFIIDPDKIIQLHLTYPSSIGRNFDEILRAIDALQLHADHQVLTPANWKPEEDVIVDPQMPKDLVNTKFPERRVQGAPYLQFSKDPSKK
ncbi:redoxin domain-containing protein [Allomuricauda sp. M10]|uniref:redoxin domain-containing protein n=1 Tax=Allomuricauda sp. M10 TaxID=2683292 RepID=UPI001D1889DD|nr:redoxin domain-containing protein [Muricauda sp. M10]